MTLSEKLTNAMKIAMKEKNKFELNVLRALKTAITAESQKKGQTNDQETIELTALTREINTRKKSIAEFEQNLNTNQSNNELVDKLQKGIDNFKAELVVLEKYAPKIPTKEELQAMLDDIVKAKGDIVLDMKKDMGVLVKELKEKAGAMADGKTIADLVKAKILG